MKKKLKWIIPLAVVVILVSAFFIYAGIYYHADEAAEKALVSGETVQVTRTDYGWFFDGPSEENALIFYPGAKVEACAYAPLCKKLAESGLDVCLVEMPLRFAFFGVNKADKIIDSMSYEHWFIGGHSLGGVFAAAYAADHANRLDGVILLASYTTEKLRDDLTTVLIYGSEDTVLNTKQYRKCLVNVPDNAVEHIIEGGNHAQFGSYGVQRGDGDALISVEEQIAETVSVITGVILEGER